MASCTLDRIEPAPGVIYLEGSKVLATAAVQWLIENDEDLGQMGTYLAAAGYGPDPLPQVGAGYNVTHDDFQDSESWLFLQRVEMHRDPSRRVKWIAKGFYGVPPRNVNPAEYLTPPLERAPRYWVESEQFTRIAENGWNVEAIPSLAGGNARDAMTPGPIVNAALQDYDLPLEETQNRLIYCKSYNVATPQEMIDIHNIYDQSLNSGLYYSAPEMHAKYRSAVCSQQQYEQGQAFHENVVRVAVSGEPFSRKIINRGYHYTSLDGNDVVLNPTNSTEPRLLTAEGELLPDGQLGNSIEYITRKLVDYTPLQ